MRYVQSCRGQRCYTAFMRKPFLFILAATLLFPVLASTSAQTPAESKLTHYLLLGSTGPQVALLQRVLNKEPDTRIAESGPGSPGNETEYFGTLTHAAVIRFQEKFASDILVPAGLMRGNGRVGAYTRTKLNDLAMRAPTASPTSASVRSTAPQEIDYEVKEKEKIDIYAGDVRIADVQQRIRTSINAAIIAGGTDGVTMPAISTTDLPSVMIQSLSPNSGLPGARVRITGTGILANSVIYFGSDKIVRSTTRDLSGSYSFVIPPVPPKRYDLAVVTSGAVSNTVPFIVVDPRNPSVRVASTSPAIIAYEGTLTITGSGFSPQNNTVVTTYQIFKDVPSVDGTSLTIRFAPENLQESAKVGTGTGRIPVGVYVVNDYGFSNADKSFIMSL